MKKQFEHAMSKKEKDMLDMIYNKKTPLTESEKKLLKEIKDAQKAGKKIYIPHD